MSIISIGGGGSGGTQVPGFQGFWNASTNSPDYTAELTDTNDFLTVTVAGTQTITDLGSTTFAIGDMLVKTATSFAVVRESSPTFGLADGTIPMIESGLLEASSLLETATLIEASKDTLDRQGSRFLGSANKESEYGGLVLTESLVTGNDYLSVIYRRNAGSLDPIGNDNPFYLTFATESNVVVQGQNPQGQSPDTITNVTQIDITGLGYHHLLNTVYLNVNAAITGLSARVTNLSNNNIIKYFPSKNAWDNNNSSINVSTGRQEIYPLSVANATPFIFPSTINLRIDLKSSSGQIDLNGLGTDPYIEVAAQQITINDLTATTFDPSSHSVTEFNDVTSAGSGAIITTPERTKLTSITNVGSGSIITAAERTSLGNIRTLEQFQDAVGDMVDGSTQTGITVTYNDTTGKLDFVVTGVPQPTSPHDLYLAVTTDNQASSVDTGTAVTSSVLNPTLTMPTFTGNRYLQILQAETHTQFTSITIGGLNQIGAFTINSGARTISGQTYRQYVSTNMLTDALSGDTVVLGGAT